MGVPLFEAAGSRLLTCTARSSNPLSATLDSYLESVKGAKETHPDSRWGRRALYLSPVRTLAYLVVLIMTVSACGASAGTTTTEAPTTTTSTNSTTMATTTSLATTTTTAHVDRPLNGRMIVLDPGHNGMNWAYPDEINQLVDIGTGTKACNTTGTSSDDGYQEADFNWAVAVVAKARLEELGATVTLTRQDNEGWGPCITERAAIGNEFGRDAVISIHADGGPATGRGFHVIYPKVVAGYTDDIAEASSELAVAMRDAYLATGMPIADYLGSDGFTVRDDLGGLTLSDVPVVFLEAGNMRNATDIALLQDPEFQAAIADAIVKALVVFLDG